jgi:protein-S-isoprenylcysteine O-methyltransferase Ste14
MSLIPVFEIGLWNGWIYILLMFLIDLGLSNLTIRLLLGKTKSQEINKRHGTTPNLNDTEKKIDQLSTIILIALIIYSIFLPIQLNTVWFYIGSFIFIIGIVFGFAAMIYFAFSPTNKPVTKGVYSISRNPMYFGMFIIFASVSIACASWLFLLLTVVWFILLDRTVVAEERLCLEMYGDSYREYLKRTSRWIGLTKSEK